MSQQRTLPDNMRCTTIQLAPEDRAYLDELAQRHHLITMAQAIRLLIRQDRQRTQAQQRRKQRAAA